VSARGIALALVAAAVPRLAWLTREALWYDELFSLQLAWGSWGELWQGAVEDHTNPPLFYALLKLWVGLGGDAAAWVRLLPALLGTAAVVPIIRLGESAGLSRGAVIAAVAVYAASPPLVFLANDARAYALLMLLSAAALTQVMALRRTTDAAAPLSLSASQLLSLCVTDVLLLHTHYFGALVVAVQLVLILPAPRAVRVGVVTAVVAAGVAFLPWASTVARDIAATGDRLANVAWLDRPGVIEAIAPLSWLVGDGPVLAVRALGGVVAVALVAAALGASRRDAGLRALAVAGLLPVALTLAASWLLPRSVWQPRYLVVTAPALVLLVGAGAALAWRRLPAALTRPAAWVGAAALVAALVVQRSRWDWKPPWDALVATLAARTPPDAAPSPVVTLEGYVTLPVAYYAAGEPRLAVRPARGLDGVPPTGGWLVWRVGAFADPTRPRRALETRGLTVVDSVSVAARRERTVAYRVRPR
jgi:uncharacterized membrane protein